jgi:hypothetical protein
MRSFWVFVDIFAVLLTALNRLGKEDEGSDAEVHEIASDVLIFKTAEEGDG